MVNTLDKYFTRQILKFFNLFPKIDSTSGSHPKEPSLKENNQWYIIY